MGQARRNCENDGAEQATRVPIQLDDGSCSAYPTEWTMTVVHADVVLSRSIDKGRGRFAIVSLSE